MFKPVGWVVSTHYFQLVENHKGGCGAPTLRMRWRSHALHIHCLRRICKLDFLLGKAALRSLLVEAAWVAVGRDRRLTETFERIKLHAGSKRARDFADPPAEVVPRAGSRVVGFTTALPKPA